MNSFRSVGLGHGLGGSLGGSNGCGGDSLSLTVPLTPHVGLPSPGPSPGPAEVRLAGVDTKEKMYEPKQRKKLVRVLTVVAYLFFVSLAAAMLSLYYVFLWNPSSKARHPTEEQLRTQEQVALRELQRIQEQLRAKLQAQQHLQQHLQHLQRSAIRPALELRQQEQEQLWPSTPSTDYVDFTEGADDEDQYTMEPPSLGVLRNYDASADASADAEDSDGADNAIPEPRAQRARTLPSEHGPGSTGGQGQPAGAVQGFRPGPAFTALRHSSLHSLRLHGLRGLRLD